MQDVRTKLHDRANQLAIPITNANSPDDVMLALLDMMRDRVFQASDQKATKRGRPSRRDVHLRINAMLETTRLESGSSAYHWSPKERIRQILMTNTDIPLPAQWLTSNNPAENAVHSQYRKWRADVARQDKTQSNAMRDEWDRFLSSLDFSIQDVVLKLCYLLNEALKDCDADDHEARKQTWREWLALANAALPEDVFHDLIYNFTFASVREVLTGEHLQNCEASRRKPYQLPSN